MAVSYAIAVACRQLVTESVNSGADSVCHALASQLYITDYLHGTCMCFLRASCGLSALLRMLSRSVQEA